MALGTDRQQRPTLPPDPQPAQTASALEAGGSSAAVEEIGTPSNAPAAAHHVDTKLEDGAVAQANPRSGWRRRRGPKTAAGKARIALNALTHGIASTRLVVAAERSTQWEAYRRSVVEALLPAGPVETALSEYHPLGLLRPWDEQAHPQPGV